MLGEGELFGGRGNEFEGGETSCLDGEGRVDRPLFMNSRGRRSCSVICVRNEGSHLALSVVDIRSRNVDAELGHSRRMYEITGRLCSMAGSQGFNGSRH
jgi:hypothetical protein